MAIQKVCNIIECQQLTQDVVLLTFCAVEMAKNAKPGQFVNISCGENMLKRPISICDVQDDLITIVFQIKGEGTKWLAERKVGDNIEVLGTLGNGYEYPEKGKILVVGGGIGVPPMLYCAKKAKNGATAIVGFRSKKNIILTDKFDNANIPVMLATDDGTAGYHGFVNDLVKQALQSEQYSAVFACGPRPMLKNVYLAAKEYDTACYVSMEERMGCGIGACLVCACSVGGHYKHVCKDGPVFNASEVDW